MKLGLPRICSFPDDDTEVALVHVMVIACQNMAESASERWGVVRDVLFRATEQPPQARAAFLERECGGDAELRREVESLLQAAEGTLFPEAPALLETVSEASLLRPGQNLAQYSIVRLIGRGGMGEVYEGRDNRLNRSVALKVIREGANGPKGRERFMREARAASALRHPGIITIYEFGQADGMDFIAMELLDGEPLSQKLREPLAQRAEYLRQAAEAIAAAHKAGIVHRDLKPANIMVTRENAVKVLDFGLARQHSPEGAPVGLLTTQGLIIGTPAYMSPEQAHGQATGTASDVFSFGVILYEMTCGVRPFGGPSALATLQEISERQPAPPQTMNPGVGTELAEMMVRCLAKKPEGRPVSLDEVVRALRPGCVGDTGTLLALVPKGPVARLPRTSTLAIAAALVLAAAAAWYVLQRPDPTEMRTEIETLPPNDVGSFALSPDGTKLAYTGLADSTARLYVRALNSGEIRALPGTEGAYQPFWATGGDAIAFWANNKLLRVGLQGGSPEQIVQAPLRGGGDWNADGKILFASLPSALFLVPAVGGQRQQVTTLGKGQTGHIQARFLPDGKRFIVYISGQRKGLYVGSVDGGEPTFLTEADSGGDYLPSGWLLWIQQNTLLARRFNLDAATLSGPTVTIAQPVASNGLTFRGAFSVSRTGMIVWREGNAGMRQLVWYSRAGERLTPFNAPDNATPSNPDLSFDDKRVVLTRGSVGNGDIWIVDDRGSTRFTFGGKDNRTNLWSPDGKNVVFSKLQSGLRIKPADGSVPDLQLGPETGGVMPNSWSPDGKWILCSVYMADLMVLPANGNGAYLPFLKTRFSESQGTFSPDGRWVAYQSNESGREEIYIRPFPGPGGVWQVSQGGGVSARWSASGKELYFIAPGSQIMAVPIHAEGGGISAGQATQLFTASGLVRGFQPQYAVSRDGRFLLNVDVASSAPIRLLQNWRPPKP